MKVSKQRRKARSLFKRGMTYHRYPDGGLGNQPQEGVSVEVALVRGRQFTKPQAAKQRDG